ncbi:hypothetical protein [Enterocloster citroniae]
MTVKKCGQDRDNIFFTGTENDFSFKNISLPPEIPRVNKREKEKNK